MIVPHDFRTKIAICELADPEGFLKVQSELQSERKWVILAPPECFISERQILLAVAASIRDFYEGVNRAKKFPLQILLRLLGVGQLSEVLERIKLESGREYLVIALAEDNPSIPEAFLKNCRKPEPCIDAVIKFYGISEEELSAVNSNSKFEAVEKLVLERIALGCVRL